MSKNIKTLHRESKTKDPWSIDKPAPRMYRQSKFRINKKENEESKKTASAFASATGAGKRLADNLKTPEKKKREKNESMKTYLVRRMKEMHG